MANPTPMLPASPVMVVPVVAIAEFTPTTRAVRSTRGPPELPGLIAASVCTALMYDEELDVVSPLVVTGRFSALTMPAVTVELSPSGEPNATTWSPTRSTCAEPRLAGGSLGPSLTYSTARSYVGLRPTTLATYLSPFWSTISIGPSCSTASATTWLLVMKSRAGSSTRRAPGAPPLRLWYCASTWTVRGSSRSATDATERLCDESGALDSVPASASPPLTWPSVEWLC